MEKEELNYVTMDTEDLETQDTAYVGTMLEEAPDMMEGTTNSNIENGANTHVILYVVIGICAIIGIAFGIFAGRKAAYK